VGWYSNCQLPCQKRKHKVHHAQSSAPERAATPALSSHFAETVGGAEALL